MSDNNTTPWDGIPDDPHESGWHWIGYKEVMEPFFWSANNGAWVDAFECIKLNLSRHEVEYLGPATPPVSRCRNGSKKVAVSARFIRDHDQVGVTMNDGSTYYLDGYYWHNGQPAFEVIGKTIPELIAAAKRYLDPKQEDPAQE